MMKVCMQLWIVGNEIATVSTYYSLVNLACVLENEL